VAGIARGAWIARGRDAIALLARVSNALFTS
jgi:hypothetical protein